MVGVIQKVSWDVRVLSAEKCSAAYQMAIYVSSQAVLDGNVHFESSGVARLCNSLDGVIRRLRICRAWWMGMMDCGHA